MTINHSYLYALLLKLKLIQLKKSLYDLYGKKYFFLFYKIETALLAIIPSIFKAPPAILCTFRY